MQTSVSPLSAISQTKNPTGLDKPYWSLSFLIPGVKRHRLDSHKHQAIIQITYVQK
jgi:hypothetical protein